MTSPPDKLFKDGLEHYRKPAPASAWNRIEAGMDQKNHKTPWLKIAASVLILVAVGYGIWFEIGLTSPGSKEQVARGTEQGAWTREHGPESMRQEAGSMGQGAESKEQGAGSMRQGTESKEQGAESKEQVATNNYPRIESKGITNLRNEIAEAPSVSSLANFESKEMAEKQVIQTEEAETVTSTANQNEIAIASIPTESARKHITYTTAEVNSKFLKQNVSPQATQEKKNTSGFLKALDLALNSEDSMLGELREKKNEWLSFNTPPKQREVNR